MKTPCHNKEEDAIVVYHHGGRKRRCLATPTPLTIEQEERGDVTARKKMLNPVTMEEEEPMFFGGAGWRMEKHDGETQNEPRLKCVWSKT
ncbi:hypothetical protein PIB30_109706, partial [Stylosanthes scabra]|nr:hypothetical protein [Stylosanthes scabra]